MEDLPRISTTNKVTAHNPLLMDKIEGHANISLDVLNLSYDPGISFLKRTSDTVQANTPSLIAPILPRINAYVSIVLFDCRVELDYNYFF